MRKYLWETSFEAAFNKMMSFGEDIVPVLDEDGKIVGDLRISEVLLKALEVGRQTGNGEQVNNHK